MQDHGIEPSLPGLPFTNRQMYWLSNARAWCGKYTDKALELQILTGYHSPNEFRVTGPMSNNVDFARDFNCPVGSRMNPEKKCKVW